MKIDKFPKNPYQAGWGWTGCVSSDFVLHGDDVDFRPGLQDRELLEGEGALVIDLKLGVAGTHLV